MRVIELTVAGHHALDLDGLLIGQRPTAHEGSGPDGYSVWVGYYLVRDEVTGLDDPSHAAAFGRRRDSISAREVDLGEIEQYVPPAGYTYGGRQNHLGVTRVTQVTPELLPFLPAPQVGTDGWEDYWTPRQLWAASQRRQ